MTETVVLNQLNKLLLGFILTYDFTEFQEPRFMRLERIVGKDRNNVNEIKKEIS